MNKKGNIISSIPFFIMGIVVIFIGTLVIIDVAGELDAVNECKDLYGNEEFCNKGSIAIECRINCEEFNLEYFKINSGGLFSNEECWCKDNIESKRLY